MFMIENEKHEYLNNGEFMPRQTEIFSTLEEVCSALDSYAFRHPGENHFAIIYDIESASP